jgi:hypothetical protein
VSDLDDADDDTDDPDDDDIDMTSELIFFLLNNISLLLNFDGLNFAGG